MKKRFCLVYIIAFTFQLMFLIVFLPTVTGGSTEENEQIPSIPSSEKMTLHGNRQLIYELNLFDGNQYQRTFCPEEIDTIYIIAGTNNILAVFETEVFSKDGDYQANWLTSQQKLQGILEIIRDCKIYKHISLEKYALYYPKGYYGGVVELLIGDEAEAFVREYKEKMFFSFEQIASYFGMYVTDIQKGFILNLPPGTYQMYFRDESEVVRVETEKTVVSFSEKSRGLGYEIIPEDKWTYPIRSSDLSENIFALRGQVMYLKPFATFRFDGCHYLKLWQLIKPVDGGGIENKDFWVFHSLPSREGLTLEILHHDTVVERITEKSYYVKQHPGYTLGYSIVEFTEKELPGRSPTFIAYKLEMPSDARDYNLRLVDEKGEPIEGSFRNLRTVQQTDICYFIFVSFFPLLIGLIVAGLHNFATRKGKSKIINES